MLKKRQAESVGSTMQRGHAGWCGLSGLWFLGDQGGLTGRLGHGLGWGSANMTYGNDTNLGKQGHDNRTPS